MPLVSVILPNYNHAEFLKARIESILNQTFQDFELIMLDDASVDESRNILLSYKDHPRVKTIEVRESNSGTPFVQWQRGFTLAEGEYIWIAESDDVADPAFLQMTVDTFLGNPDTGLVYCPSLWIDGDGKVIHEPGHESEGFKKEGLEVIREEFTRGSMIYNASTVVFKKALLQHIDFKELVTFRFAGDWYFWVHLLAHTRIVRLGKRLNFYRRHDKNVSFKSEKEGLHFSEGFRIVNIILEKYSPGLYLREKALMYWALKIRDSEIEQKDSYLKILPFEARVWYVLMPLLKRFRS